MYLTDKERQIAPEIYRTLQDVHDQICKGRRDYQELESQAIEYLNKKGFNADYLMIRRASDLLPPSQNDHDLVIIVAAWLGKARLIDNLPVTL
jgi:pantoate--beta-alanine ligase